MSLIKQFPEIESFFRNDEFSQEDLDTFIKKIEMKYTVSSILTSAKSLIQLELLKFELQKDLKSVGKPSKKQKESPKFNKLSSLPTEISLLAKKLEWSTKHLIRLLEQRNICKNETDSLTPEEFASIRAMVKARYAGVNRNRTGLGKRKLHRGHIEIKNNKSIYTDSVYDKLSLYGLGKLIYIRSK